MIIITAHTWVKWSNNNISARTRHLLWRLYCFKMSNDKHSRFIHLKSYSKAVLRGKAKIFLLFWHHNVKARFWNHKRREFLILNQNSVLCCYFTLTTVTFYCMLIWNSVENTIASDPHVFMRYSLLTKSLIKCPLWEFTSDFIWKCEQNLM